jgi:predicted O-methyltransferase YrrM
VDDLNHESDNKPSRSPTSLGRIEEQGMGRSLIPEPIERYVWDVMSPETPLQKRLRAETAKLPDCGMQIGPDQARFLSLLARLTGTKRALEIGTFTGCSALAVASALPADGKLVACDISAEWTAIGQRYWEEAGVAGRIDLRLGPAADTLAEMIGEGLAKSFDLAFIDADKPSYDTYYEACLTLIRPGGLIVVDNTLWDGKVANPSINDPETAAIRALNLKVRDDPRVEPCLLSLGDGVLLARVRA